MTDRFRALVVDKSDASFSVEIKEMTLDELPPGEVTIRVAWSGVNYKDGLAGIPDGRILETYPLIPGIDLAGTVIHSSDSRFKEGEEVIVASAELVSPTTAASAKWPGSRGIGSSPSRRGLP